jgi:TRAP-type transport system periplasmic protein
VPSGVWRVKMFKAYGANPTPLAYGEVFAALQAGVMDGQENPFPQIYAGKFYEVQKYLSLSDHLYSPAFAVISEKFWKTLPPDVQQTLTRIGAEVGDFARAEGARMDKEILGKIQDKLKVNQVDKIAFTGASRPIYEEFGKAVPGGTALVERILAIRN